MNIFMILFIKVYLIYSIIKIELIYYRNLSEYMLIAINIFLIYSIIITSSFEDLIGIILVFIILNIEFLYILFTFKLPVVRNNFEDVSLLILSNEKESIEDSVANNSKIDIMVLYKDHFLFLINKSSIIPHLTLPLIKEYIETPNLDTHKLDFIKNNLIISFDLPEEYHSVES